MDYWGSCHCGAVRFGFSSISIRRGWRCNCSLCRRRGTVMSDRYVVFRELTGRDSLSVYRFGDDRVEHFFCRSCGVHVFHRSREHPDRYRVNLACIDRLELVKLEIGLIDGRAF